MRGFGWWRALRFWLRMRRRRHQQQRGYHQHPRTAARYGVVLEEVARDALDRHAERLSRRAGEK